MPLIESSRACAWRAAKEMLQSMLRAGPGAVIDSKELSAETPQTGPAGVVLTRQR